MIKYLALILVFIAGIISTFIPLNSKVKKNKIWKKTWTYISIIAFFFTFYQTCDDENTNNREKKNLQNSKKQDSLRLVKLIKQSDTTVNKLEKYERKFEEIIQKADLTVKKLNKTEIEVRKQTQNILKSAHEVAKNQLEDNRKIKFPIPNKIDVSFDIELLLDKNNTDELDSIIRTAYKIKGGSYSEEDNVYINLSGIQDIMPSSSQSLLSINNIKKSFISCRIYFEDKNGVQLLNLGSTYKNSFSMKDLQSNILYSSKKKKLYLNVDLLELKTFKSKQASSLLDIENSKLVFEFGLMIFLEHEKGLITPIGFGVNLIHINFETEGLNLNVNDFVRVPMKNDMHDLHPHLGFLRVNSSFEKKLTKKEIWK